MPVKGSKLKLGNRDYVFCKKFYEKNLVVDSKVTLPFLDCKNIIETANKNIADAMVDEIDGFKLPFGMGYICAGKFKPQKPPVDFNKTRLLGKIVYHLNLHTLGFSARAYWFRIGRIENVRFHEVFKFQPYETLSIKISKAFGSGKNYNEWTVEDFVEMGRLENLYTKKYRKEQKE